MRPIVAICIPTYNQQQFLSAAVESAFGQTYSDVEVLVRDDASTDDTSTVLHKLKDRFPTLRFERAPSNSGITKTVTWLFENTNCPYIVRLDSDDVLSPNYVATLLAAMQAHPGSGYAHAAVQEIDANGRPTRVRRLARSAIYQDPEESLCALLSGYRVAANILMFRRTALETVDFLKGFPERGEDYLLAVKLADLGFGNVYSPDILSSYRVWGEQWTLPRRLRELDGLRCVYHEGLVKCFERRGWDTRRVYRCAERRACSESDLLRYADCRGEMAEHVEELLRALGDGPALSTHIWLVNHGFGGIFSTQTRANRYLRHVTKEILALLREGIGKLPLSGRFAKPR